MALAKIRTDMPFDTAQMSEPSSKKEIAPRRIHLALRTVRSWPTRRMRPHWVTR